MSDTENFQAEGTAPTKALFWVGKDTYLSNKRHRGCQRGARWREGRGEVGDTCRKKSEAVLSLPASPHPASAPTILGEAAGGEECSQNNPKCN